MEDISADGPVLKGQISFAFLEEARFTTTTEMYSKYYKYISSTRL